MTLAQVVKMSASVTINSPSQDCTHPDGHTLPRYDYILPNYPAVRTGSSNTHFFSVVLFFFFGGHLPQTSGFRSAKQILVASFTTQARAFILSDRNLFYTPPPGGGGGGENNGGV